MAIELEEFSLRHIISQFREFNSATKRNYENLAPYFWWARANNFQRFKFIFCATMVEKMARVLHDLPYNKKFIIRANGEFAGIVGLDLISTGAISSELWIFIDSAHAHKHIASNALKQIEDFARTKSVQSIRANTSPKNTNSKHLLAKNDYEPTYTDSNSILWYKLLNAKIIEK